MLTGIILGPPFLVKYFKIIGNIKKKKKQTTYETLSNTSIGMIFHCAFSTHQKDAHGTVWLWYQYLLQRYELNTTYKHSYQHTPYHRGFQKQTVSVHHQLLASCRSNKQKNMATDNTHQTSLRNWHILKCQLEEVSGQENKVIRN